MTLEQVVEKFKEKQYLLEMGKGKLSKYLKTSEETIKKAKKIAREEIKNTAPRGLPKILIFDLETAPLKAFVWRRWKQNIYGDQLLSDWFLLTWSAKWLFSDVVMSDKLSGEEVLAEDDSRIVKNFWKLVDEADIVIAHNGDKFDVPKMNSRFIVNGLPPASSYQTIDTKKVAAKQFGFSSNSLNELAKIFGFDGKLDTDFELWAECMKGNEEALAYMQKYNDKDVELLEEIYLKLRPYINAHPNVGMYLESDVPVCANCGNSELKDEGKYYYTQAGRYKTYRCTCGALSRVRNTNYPKDKRKQLIVSTAK